MPDCKYSCASVPQFEKKKTSETEILEKFGTLCLRSYS